MVAFSQIQSTKRIPLAYFEFSASGEGSTPDFVQPTVICGQMLEGGSAGTAAEGQRYLVTSAGQAATLFGRGSVLHLMCAAFLAQHPTGELYAIAAGDAAGATAASATLTFTGTATAAGSLFLRINGRLVEVGVTSGMTAIQAATAVVAAIAADTNLAVTAAAGANPNEHVVTLTAKSKGTVGNQNTVSLNALGPNGGETIPTGLACAVSSALMASGATDNLATVWTNVLVDDRYDHFVPQSNTTLLTGLQTEVLARWNANRALGGQIWCAAGDAAADLLTLASGENDPYTSILGYKEAAGWLSAGYEIAAAYAGVAARELGNDPGIPLQTLPLVGIWGGSNFTATERDLLANGGVATCTSRNTVVSIEFEATTYRTDTDGDDDNTYEVVQTPATLWRMGLRFGQRIETRYPRHKLADDGTPIPSGSRVVTPQLIRSELVAEYSDMIGDLAEDLATFQTGLVVERNEDNPNRVDASIPPDLINQFRVFAGSIKFKN